MEPIIKKKESCYFFDTACPTSTFVALSFSSMTCLSIVSADLQASLNVMDYNSVDRIEIIICFCKG